MARVTTRIAIDFNGEEAKKYGDAIKKLCGRNRMQEIGRRIWRLFVEDQGFRNKILNMKNGGN